MGVCCDYYVLVGVKLSGDKYTLFEQNFDPDGWDAASEALEEAGFKYNGRPGDFVSLHDGYNGKFWYLGKVLRWTNEYGEGSLDYEVNREDLLDNWHDVYVKLQNLLGDLYDNTMPEIHVIQYYH